MKYKYLSKEQLIISFDRLTRFKPTKEKYFRVFSDIILSDLIEPVLKKQDLENMSEKEITNIAVEIINGSLCNINPCFVSSSQIESLQLSNYKNIINIIIKNCENSTYINDKKTQDYLDNKINYNAFISLIDESCPINLRWLKTLTSEISQTYNNEFLSKLRQEKGLKFPIKKVLLVEGITEEILLPAFSKYIGYDFYKEGIHIIAAGGKNQVVKMYYKLITELKIPIFILLDNDAEDNINQIKPKLRKTDKIHLVSCGEFEDLLPKSLIIKTINNELSNFASVTEDDIDNSLSEVENLENIFKAKGLHEFKKADFAKLVRDNISEYSDISKEIISIIRESIN